MPAMHDGSYTTKNISRESVVFGAVDANLHVVDVFARERTEFAGYYASTG